MISTLPELLLARSSSTAQLGFLDAEGSVASSLTYAQLYAESQEYTQRLLSAGLKNDGTDIVVTSFSDHESHIRIFWACCLAGIPICPIPPLHPDQSRRTLFLKHLQGLFNGPTIIADDETIQGVIELIPTFKFISLSRLNRVKIDFSANADVFPQKHIKDDDIVCFMLTSGSTGNSKAVSLRHSNLLSSIQGKIKHHKTTSISRFLNWIAFDHVACVSEVHLQALKADATQFHVAPTAIIRNPSNLLNWCGRLKISYTFSPNFLLGQICRDADTASYAGNAPDLSSLRAFISGGESVPVSTAIDFAALLERFGSPKNVLRAGFGMTETGAGCIYDTRAIPRDISEFNGFKYLSLGKCCDGTNIRVINPATGDVCPVLQEGQLQISGPTVFREYYNNHKATAESFDGSWFITGDTALIDQENDLHLMGRDKDCVNINGVKHPSVDIENYLQDLRINGSMKSYIYVCPIRLPNANTETYGVFYQHNIVVENTMTQDDLRAVAATNSAIKNACFVFCSQAPHIVLPLSRKSFIKTALGKISRSALVVGYFEGEYEAIQQSLVLPDDVKDMSNEPQNVVDQILFQSVAEVFGSDISTLKRFHNIFDVGASSMHLMQLKQLLQGRLSIADIPTIEFLQKPKLGDLSDYLTCLLSPASVTTPVQYNPVVCFNSDGSKPPLFLVHPGVGEVLVFMNLARELANDQPLYALRARGFDADQTPFTTFVEMVDCYTLAIEKTYPSGPYYVGGYSFGGAVAFEIGKKLQGRGKDVAWVGTFNLPPHIQFRMKELVWVEVLINLCMFLALVTTKDFDKLKAALYEQFPYLKESDAEPPSAERVIQWLFDNCNQERLATLHLKLRDFKRWVSVAYSISYSARDYEPRGYVYGALLSVFCAVPLPSMGTKEEFKQQRLSKWKEFAKDGFEMIDVDGEHYNMINEEHVVSFARKLRAALTRAEEAYDKRFPSLIQSSLNLSAPKQDFDLVPIVDFSLANTNREEYFRQLSFALEDVGFAVLINVPGFEHSFQEELFTLAEALFSKPLEWKQSLGTQNSYALRGYFRADDVVGEHKAYAEAYRFGADLPAPEFKGDSDVPFWLKLHEGPNQWPAETDLPTFRIKMETLFERYHSLNIMLNKHICELLNIPYNVLDDFFSEKIEFNSALWHYFPLIPEMLREAKDEFLQGMHEHRDPSTFVTCLIQSRQGLEVQNHHGKWVDVPYVKGGVVCNIGLQLMRLTGGRLVATLHRVNTLKIDKDRYTIPYVLSTRLEKSVSPLPQFNNPEMAKVHAAPNPRIQRLMAIEDPLIRSGFARLSLFPAVTRKLYPVEFEEGRRLGIL